MALEYRVPARSPMTWQSASAAQVKRRPNRGRAAPPSCKSVGERVGGGCSSAVSRQSGTGFAAGSGTSPLPSSHRKPENCWDTSLGSVAPDDSSLRRNCCPRYIFARHSNVAGVGLTLGGSIGVANDEMSVVQPMALRRSELVILEIPLSLTFVDPFSERTPFMADIQVDEVRS